ncbi:MAG: NAD(P)-dependent oxidoreductase [Pseudomonadota bacterium]
MQTFPMFLKMKDRKVVIIGGGEAAAQKTRLILKTEAKILLVADELNEELQGYVDQGKVTHHPDAVTPALLQEAIITFSATEDAQQGAYHAALARPVGALINVVDEPDHCEAITPAIVDRDPVVVAIGTEGKGPVLGRLTKRDIEIMLEPKLGELVDFAGRMRIAVAEKIKPALRREFWRWVFDGQPRQLFAQGKEKDAYQLIESQINAEGQDLAKGGVINHIELVSDTVDMLTLRAVRHMQEADAIYYDEELPAGLLEPARRDAERIAFDPADYIKNFEAAEARKAEGQKIVFMTRELSSDPFD